MRLTSMNRLLLATVLLAGLPAMASAQYSAPPNTVNNFKDTSMIKPPAGSKVAVIEFEDLECPACAHASPIVHDAVSKYKIPYVRYDYPLRMHIWSFDAAVTARYLQDKVSPDLANEYRSAVFASQTAIASKDDLQHFTQSFFQKRGKAMPFVMDPTGQLTQEVKKDQAFGDKVGLTQTPTIFVVTPKAWVQVTDVSYLTRTIDAAIAQEGGTGTTATASAHPVAAAHATAKK
ncbi:MAG TPA: thioredoxin domain-containing protein [Granulicella sp.]